MSSFDETNPTAPLESPSATKIRIRPRPPSTVLQVKKRSKRRPPSNAKLMQTPEGGIISSPGVELISDQSYPTNNVDDKKALSLAQAALHVKTEFWGCFGGSLSLLLDLSFIHDTLPARNSPSFPLKESARRLHDYVSKDSKFGKISAVRIMLACLADRRGSNTNDRAAIVLLSYAARTLYPEAQPYFVKHFLKAIAWPDVDQQVEDTTGTRMSREQALRHLIPYWQCLSKDLVCSLDPLARETIKLYSVESMYAEEEGALRKCLGNIPLPYTSTNLDLDGHDASGSDQGNQMAEPMGWVQFVGSL